jgi:hypothetical protein
MDIRTSGEGQQGCDDVVRSIDMKIHSTYTKIPREKTVRN